jgi:hypothetical protein
VSSPALAYGFAPWALLEATPGAPLVIDATLHAEVRKTFFHGVVRRTFGKPAEPQRYEIATDGPDFDDISVDPANWTIVARTRPEVRVRASEIFGSSEATGRQDGAPADRSLDTTDARSRRFEQRPHRPAPSGEGTPMSSQAVADTTQQFLESTQQAPDDDITRLLLDEVTWLREELRTTRESLRSAELRMAVLEGRRPWWRRGRADFSLR